MRSLAVINSLTQLETYKNCSKRKLSVESQVVMSRFLHEWFSQDFHLIPKMVINPKAYFFMHKILTKLFSCSKSKLLDWQLAFLIFAGKINNERGLVNVLITIICVFIYYSFITIRSAMS